MSQRDRLARLRSLLTPGQVRVLREVLGWERVRVVTLAELEALNG